MIRGQKGAAPDEEATPEGWVVLVFPKSKKVHGKRGGKMGKAERSQQDLQSCFGRDPLSEAWPEDKASAEIFWKHQRTWLIDVEGGKAAQMWIWIKKCSGGIEEV